MPRRRAEAERLPTEERPKPHSSGFISETHMGVQGAVSAVSALLDAELIDGACAQSKRLRDAWADKVKR